MNTLYICTLYYIRIYLYMYTHTHIYIYMLHILYLHTLPSRGAEWAQLAILSTAGGCRYGWWKHLFTTETASGYA